MSEILILGKKDIENIFTMDMALSAVERAYREKAAGGGLVWPMVFHEFDPGKADLDIKSGQLGEEKIFGSKTVSWFGSNPEKGKPALYGTSLIFDMETGEPKALLNAGPVTDMRTGAAAAVGAKYLARKDSENMLMAGSGQLAPYIIAAALIACPCIKSVTIVNPHHPEKAGSRLSGIIKETDEIMKAAGCERKSDIVSSADIEDAVRKSDIIMTATPAYEPFIKREWVGPGTHISCVGADLPGKQEIDAEILAAAAVYGDDASQCINAGECEKAYKSGILKGLDAEIGEVISGSAAGRTGDEQITVFDSTGIALQDLASAAVIIKKAEKMHAGVRAEL